MKRRLTKQKQLILEYLQSNHTHPNAEKIYEFVQKQIPTITLATVYRNLHILVEEGLAKSIKIDGQYRFDGVIEKHHHFCCQKCNTITDINAHDMKIRAPKHFTIHDITLKGVCSDCS